MSPSNPIAAGKGSRVAPPLVVPASNSEKERPNKMAKQEKPAMPEPVRLPVTQIDAVNCPNSTNVKTADGFTHSMIALFPSLVVESNTLESFQAGFNDWMTKALGISAGAEIQILDADGNVIKTVTATDDVPTFEEREPTVIKKKDDKGNVMKDENGNDIEETLININHGQAFAKSLPIDFLKLTDAFNTGIKDAVRYDRVTKINKQFRSGEGKRGRAGASVDLTKITG